MKKIISLIILFSSIINAHATTNYLNLNCENKDGVASIQFGKDQIGTFALVDIYELEEEEEMPLKIYQKSDILFKQVENHSVHQVSLDESRKIQLTYTFENNFWDDHKIQINFQCY